MPTPTPENVAVGACRPLLNSSMADSSVCTLSESDLAEHFCAVYNHASREQKSVGEVARLPEIAIHPHAPQVCAINSVAQNPHTPDSSSPSACLPRK